MKKFLRLIVLVAICSSGTMAYAQSRPNYGTERCKVLVQEANALYNKGKYEEAKVLYNQALATGDNFFQKKCVEQLNMINKIQASKKKSTSTVFTISDDSITIEHNGGQKIVNVNGTKWNASPKNYGDWCKIEIDKRYNRIIINADPNEDTQDRTASITITNGNGQKKTVIVTNEAAPEILRSSAQSLMFTPTGETNVVDIDANTQWDITDVPDWLDAVKGEKDIRFTADANTNNNNRVAQVKVETPTRQEIIINIIQGASLDSLAFSKNDLHFGPNGGDEYIRVLTDAVDWRFGDFPHWCQLTRIDDQTIKIHCTPNDPVDMPREASVNVTTGHQVLGINVSQDPMPIVHLIPTDGIGGRHISFGFAAGYVIPMISTGSGGAFTGSPVNYALGNVKENSSYNAQSSFMVKAYTDIRLYKNLYMIAGLEFMQYKYSNDFSMDFERFRALSVTTKYQKGMSQNRYQENYTFNNLSLPILASYRIPITKKSHVQINAGPIVSYGLNAKMKISGNTDANDIRNYKLNSMQMTDIPADNIREEWHYSGNGSMGLYSNDVKYTETWSDAVLSNRPVVKDRILPSAPFKRLNIGAVVGAGFEYMGIGIAIEYTLFLTNMADDRYWNGDRWMIFDQSAETLMSGYKQRNNYLSVKIGYTFRY